MAALQAKGVKPKTTEYILQQMIFVVPANKKGITGKRKAEAEASRAKYPGCDGAKVFAATMKDVSVRNLGRLLAPELPSDWKPLIEKTKPGGTTATRVTEKGVEYLAICKQREVSDDLAAETVFKAENLGKSGDEEDPNGKTYIEDLRSKAQIVIN
jgi:peptidyl-prolyl cis-trans isomerase SurA